MIMRFLWLIWLIPLGLPVSSVASPTGLTLHRNRSNHKVHALEFNKPSNSIAATPKFNRKPQELAQEFLRQHSKDFGAKPDASFSLQEEQQDELGQHHLRYQQYYQGVPVYGATIIVHLNAVGEVARATGELQAVAGLHSTPTITSTEATQIAQQQWRLLYPGGVPETQKTELVVLLIKGNPHLCWRINLVGLGDNRYYFIDAHLGHLLNEAPGIFRLNRSVYDCSTRDGDCHLGWQDSTTDHVYGRAEGQLPTGPSLHDPRLRDVDYLYDHLGIAFNFLRTYFGRNGANNSGGLGPIGSYFGLNATTAIAYAELAPDIFNLRPEHCPNAGYGDQGIVIFCSGLPADLDVVAHEYFHGLTHSTANLIYQDESGALNEAFSDIMAEATEHFAYGVTDWNMSGFRNLMDPSASFPLGEATPHPDRFYSPDFYCGVADYGGVHHNSTVLSHAAYLTAMGGTHNGCYIQGLGLNKQVHIFYRALTTYLTPTSTFNAAYTSLKLACADLYTTKDCLELTKALQAVELDQAGRCSKISSTPPECRVVLNPGTDIVSRLSDAGGLLKRARRPIQISPVLSNRLRQRNRTIRRARREFIQLLKTVKIDLRAGVRPPACYNRISTLKVSRVLKGARQASNNNLTVSEAKLRWKRVTIRLKSILKCST